MVQLSLDGWTYDVFLNFRGTDTRNGFTGNLYNALRQRGINTFFDEQGLQRGEEISPSLYKAIKESRMAIVVFSENYASSAYCLNELVLILQCLKGEGRLVWPIFYDVEPSQVRYQKGSYGEALAKQNRYSKEKLQEWKLALFEAANLSGWTFDPRNESEYQFIGMITKEVSIKINRAPLYGTDYPVGLDSRVLEVISLLDVESINSVSMVGIHGIGGIGKTTIARAVYNFMGNQFEGVCFLDIRTISEKHGLLHLQEKLLFELVGEKDIKLVDVSEGRSIIRHRLHQKKVLLVLDDVDQSQQLKAVAGRYDWFGSGSRIIITTRDKHLLARHGVEVERMYELEKLNDEEALQLFIRNAFKEEPVPHSYLRTSKRAVSYCSGLPLALEVIGSNFYGKGIEEWNSALDGYERAPDKEIFRVLKISYDSLDNIQKEIFLDVACFFKGEKLEDVKDMLRSVRGITSEYVIGVLIDRSLIKIEYGRLTMHDLIEDMGKEIIQQESPNEPGGRSRLWIYQDILHVLQENTGTNKVEGIVLDLPKGKEIQWSGKTFKTMKNLRMLIIKYARFSRPPTILPSSLRLLDWSHYQWEFLPHDFHPTNLVHLKLSNYSCELLKPLITKNFETLIEMCFSNSEFLTLVPDLSVVPNLQKLYLNNCPRLIEIHDSVGSLSKLRVLSAELCTNLRTLPRGIKLISLELLSFEDCSSLQSFPEVLEKMEKTKYLDLSGTAIEELPYSICNLTGLERLYVDECRHLKQLPTSILMLPKLWWLNVELCGEFKKFSKCKGEEREVSSVVLSELKVLRLSNCNLSDEYLSICLSCFPYLERLDLSYNSFTILPACIKECHLLRYLRVENCKQLRIIEGLPPNLVEFNAKNCTSLISLSSDILRVMEGLPPNLVEFDASNCTSLTSLSSDMLLNQALRVAGTGRREFILPGQRVPEWFDHYSDGESMCFWVRGEFPDLLLCFVVVGVLDDKDGLLFYRKLFVRINGIDVTVDFWMCRFSIFSSVLIDHIVLIDLQKVIPLGKLQKLLKDRWNQVELLCMNHPPTTPKRGKIKWSGVYVYEQEKKENIRFSRPTSTKRTWYDLYDSNNDLELSCYPLIKKQRASLDIQHQRGLASTSDTISGQGFLYSVKRLLFSCFGCFGL